MEIVLANIEIMKAWVEAYTGVIVFILGAGLLVQWVAIQYLFIQNHFLRAEVKKPHPDIAKIKRYETRLSNLEGQFPLIFEKLAEQKEELRKIERESISILPSQSVRPESSTSSIESSFVSMGEINLKKRLDAIKGQAPRES